MARDRLLRHVIRERFHITLTSGETFDGLLDAWDTNHLTFVDAGVITQVDDTRTRRVKVDGQLYLPRERIAYMQQTLR